MSLSRKMVESDFPPDCMRNVHEDSITIDERYTRGDWVSAQLVLSRDCTRLWSGEYDQPATVQPELSVTTGEGSRFILRISAWYLGSFW